MAGRIFTQAAIRPLTSVSASAAASKLAGTVVSTTTNSSMDDILPCTDGRNLLQHRAHAADQPRRTTQTTPVPDVRSAGRLDHPDGQRARRGPWIPGDDSRPTRCGHAARANRQGQAAESAAGRPDVSDQTRSGGA